MHQSVREEGTPSVDVEVPERSVNLPPASRTMTATAAMSHGPPKVRAMSHFPVATRRPGWSRSSGEAGGDSGCNSDHRARTSGTRSTGVSSGKGRVRAPRTDCRSDTRSRTGPEPASPKAPRPRAAHVRRQQAGWSATPISSSPSTSRAIKDPQAGDPWMKLRVPSMGSTNQRRPDRPVCSPASPSSPITSSLGLPR